MPGLRTALADLCMFGLAACDEGTRVCQRECADDHQCQTSWGAVAEKCGSMRRHAQVNADNTIETRERTGPWVRQVAQAMEEQLKEDQQEPETREHQWMVEDAKRIRRIVHENDKNKGLSHVQNEMGRLMHHDEQELLSVWEGWQWDDKIGGLVDPDLCAQARREAVEYIRRHKCTQGSPEKLAYVRRERHPARQDGRRRTGGNQGSPTCARDGSRRNKTHARPEYTRQRRHSRR